MVAMSLSTKFFLLMLMLNIGFLKAQIVKEDPEIEQEIKSDPETVFFNFEVFRPIPFGDNSLAMDYSMGPGVAFDFNWFATPELTFGTHASITGGSVDDISRIGNIEKTTIYLFGLDVGYYHAFDEEWNVHATAGLGALDYHHSAPEDKFSESGTSYWVQVQVGYRINRTIAVYFKMQPRYDRLNIAAPASIERYINNQLMINSGIGFRVNLQNPGG